MRLTEGAKRALLDLSVDAKQVLGDVVGIAHSLHHYGHKLSSEEVVEAVEDIRGWLSDLMVTVAEAETSLGIDLPFVNAGERPDENEKSAEF